jgi:hypothetical protein
MSDLPDGQEPRPATTPPRVLIVDFGPSAYPEDDITLLERWANWGPLNNLTRGAITKTTTTARLPLLID